MRCPWCGNTNDSAATECAFCQKDLVRDQSTQDAVDLLERIVPPEPEVECPVCGASNFLSTEFCDLCRTPLRPDAVWPTAQTPPIGRSLFDRLETGSGVFDRFAPLVAVAVVYVGVTLLVLGGLGGSNSDRAASQTARPAATTATAPRNTTAASGADGASFVDDSGHKRRIPKEKISAKERAEIAAEEAARLAGGTPSSSGSSTYRSLGSSTSTARFSGRAVLPLPPGSIPKSSKLSNSGGYSQGTRVFDVGRSVDAAVKTYDYTALTYAALGSQGLIRNGSNGRLDRAQYDKGKTVYTEFTQYFGVEGHKDCKITVDIKPLAGSATRSRITVTYKLPKGSTLTMR